MTPKEILALVEAEEKITQGFVRQTLKVICETLIEIERTAMRSQSLSLSNARNLGAVSVLVEQVAKYQGIEMLNEIEFNKEFEKRN